MVDFTNSIHDVGHRVATYKHLELVIASTLSRWVDIISEPNACALVGSHAHIHADHAEWWDSRLPVLWDKAASDWNIDGDEEIVQMVSQLENNNSYPNTVDKLHVMYRQVLPALLQTYSAHHVTTDPQVDPATVRILQSCIADTRDLIENAHHVITELSTS
jgi:hypothetical protein